MEIDSVTYKRMLDWVGDAEWDDEHDKFFGRDTTLKQDFEDILKAETPLTERMRLNYLIWRLTS